MVINLIVMPCVFFPFILDIKFVERTSRGSHRRKVTGFFIHLPSAVRALIFLARRIQSFLSLVDREVEFAGILCTNDLIVLHSLDIIYIYTAPVYIYVLLVSKIPFAGIELTPQRFRRFTRLPLNYRGDRPWRGYFYVVSL